MNNIKTKSGFVGGEYQHTMYKKKDGTYIFGTNWENAILVCTKCGDTLPMRSTACPKCPAAEEEHGGKGKHGSKGKHGVGLICRFCDGVRKDGLRLCFKHDNVHNHSKTYRMF